MAKNTLYLLLHLFIACCDLYTFVFILSNLSFSYSVFCAVYTEIKFDNISSISS